MGFVIKVIKDIYSTADGRIIADVFKSNLR
jgi:hypothetical protein